MTPIDRVRADHEAPIASTPTDGASVAPDAAAAVPAARPRPFGTSDLGGIQTHRLSPAASDPAPRPRAESALQDAPRQRHSAVLGERRANSIEFPLAAEDGAQLEVELDNEALVDDNNVDEDQAAPGMTDPLLPDPLVAQLVLPADTRPVATETHFRDGQRHVRDADDSTEPHAMESNALTAAACAAVKSHHAVEAARSAASMMHRVEPIVAAASAMAQPEMAVRRLGVQWVGALAVLGLVLIGLSLLALFGSSSSNADEDSPAAKPPEREAPARSTL
jgi:hypothetical protein